MSSGMKVRGTADMKRKILAWANKQPQVIGNALRAEMEIEATEAKRRTPVDTGTLRGTVQAIGPDISGSSISAGIVAGGPSAPYAVYVHENLEAHHPVGQAKFIESVIDEVRPHLLLRIAYRLRASGWRA